ncbi:MAG: hypothetical protein ACPGYV_02800 [Phycisphaeraceae bacterium]
MLILLSSPATAARNKMPEPELVAVGEQIRADYAEMLETLSAKVIEKLPSINNANKTAFLQAREVLEGLERPGEDADAKAFHDYQSALAEAEANALAAARTVLAEAKDTLNDASLDPMLLRVAILRHGTPAGLAEFAQQSPEHKSLIDDLLADETLMKQVLMAGGANGGEYGEAMEVYAAILNASERARERGSVFQRLALGTALHQPWLNSSAKQSIAAGNSINAPIFIDHQTPEGQVARYLHYEKAYLDGELDPAFENFSAWEFRYVTNDPYTNAELAWGREMLRNFRPDHITNPDYSWRYVGMVRSDFPYCSTRHDPSLGMPQQQALALGGVCGKRAFFGRFITRAFGIPARRSSQTGHAAMNMWTPDGWVVRLGAWWTMNWCGSWRGIDFYLESQARRDEAGFMQVRRAEWISDALGEEDVSMWNYGEGGGFWEGLAHFKKRAIVQDAQIEQKAEEIELAALSAEEARLRGESNEIFNGTEIEEIEIADELKAITVSDDGVITVPAVACTSPKNNTDKIRFLTDLEGGMQLHYKRVGNRPEILRYNIEAPKAGKYALSMLVSTVSHEGMETTYRINRRTMVNPTFPYTKGAWEYSEPEVIELREGRNSVQITLRAPNRGISIKSLKLTPID